MCLAETHAMDALDDSANSLEGPQFSAKPMFSWTLQDGRTHRGQLALVKLGRPASPGHRTKRIDSTPIEQRLPCVHGLARNAHCQRNLGATLALLQHPPSAQTPLCSFAQPLLHHANILQQ